MIRDQITFTRFGERWPAGRAAAAGERQAVAAVAEAYTSFA
ncbi:hypothetical protein [Actinoplanes sp. ATCC 53533]|nr:hypothetical protein [Actinoplanes sp. ATCC 53533]